MGGGPPPPPPPQRGGPLLPTGGVIASLQGVLKYLKLQIRSTVQGQCVSVLVDNGATHFIDAQMVEWRGIHIKSFEWFLVLVLGDWTMQCTRYVPNVTLTMGNYSVTVLFFIVDVLDTNVEMGV